MYIFTSMILDWFCRGVARQDLRGRFFARWRASVKLAMKSTGNVVSEGGTDNLCYASEPVIIHSLFVKGNRVWISV